jgi:HEPN domain-containing protein
LFHCQQAAEKALKGFLAWHDQPFPKTHDLGKLGKQAVEVDPTLEPLIEVRGFFNALLDRLPEEAH